MTIFDQKHKTENSEDHSSPEHYLWTSVLSKAAHDAIFTSDWRESKLAISWFKDMGKGFREVCNFAGRDPQYVHDRMMKAISKRELYMQAVKTGARTYVAKNTKLPVLKTGAKVYHSHYRGSRLKLVKKKKNLKMVLRGSKGGRPKLYVV